MKMIAIYAGLILVVGYIVMINLINAMKTHKRKRVSKKSRLRRLDRRLKEIIKKD